MGYFFPFFNKPPFAMNPNKNEPERNSLKKGVVHRSIYEVEDNQKEFIKKIKHFESAGETIRINEKLPLKLIIFDRKNVVMTLHNNSDMGSLFTAMSIDQRDFANSMADIFELYWRNSMSVDEYIKTTKNQRGKI